MKIPIHNSWVVRSIHLGRGEAAGTWMGERILKGALPTILSKYNLLSLMHHHHPEKLHFQYGFLKPGNTAVRHQIGELILVLITYHHHHQKLCTAKNGIQI